MISFMIYKDKEPATQTAKTEAEVENKETEANVKETEKTAAGTVTTADLAMKIEK